MPARTRTACIGLQDFHDGGDQITCVLCGQTLEAVPVWLHPDGQRTFTAECGYFREYRGIVLRNPW